MVNIIHHVKRLKITIGEYPWHPGETLGDRAPAVINASGMAAKLEHPQGGHGTPEVKLVGL